MRQRFIYCEDCPPNDAGRPVVDAATCPHRNGGYRGPTESVTVIYKNAAGKVITPWTKDGKPPKGYQRIEVRGGAELRRFEREMNQREKDRHENHIERRERVYEPQIKAAREDLLRSIRTPLGREIALAAIERNNRRSRTSNYESGFHRDR